MPGKTKPIDLLIIGKQPPPIGGVSIHVDRLINALSQQKKISYSFLDLNNFSFFQFFRFIRKARLIHLHSSNPYFRFGIAAICFLFRKKLISTIHGNLGRFNLIGNIFDYLGLILTYYPVTVNASSQKLAVKLNSRSKLISPFIPPYKLEPLNNKITKDIMRLKQLKDVVFCTNASNVSFDKNGNEIYGISKLISIFENLPKLGLVCSDPSGNYSKFLKELQINIPNNVIFISEAHSFIEIIKLSNAMLRTTTTDGDSLSVKEALFFNKDVIASDCTARPDDVILYKTGNKDSLIKVLTQFHLSQPKRDANNGFIDLEKLYEQGLASE